MLTKCFTNTVELHLMSVIIQTIPHYGNFNSIFILICTFMR